MALPDSPLDIDAPDVSMGARIEIRDGRLWVCVDGQCVLRVRGCTQIEIADYRIKVCPECGASTAGSTVSVSFVLEPPHEVTGVEYIPVCEVCFQPVDEILGPSETTWEHPHA